MIRLLPVLLLAGVLVLHDAGPARHEHAWGGLVVTSDPARHAGHTAASHQDAAEIETDVVVETCGTVRLGPNANQPGGTQAKGGTVMAMPASSTMDAFVAVCLPRIGHPPGNPPERLRAFFSVYRI